MTDPHEVWLPTEVKGYEVSNLGRVRSWKPRRNFAPIPIEPRVLKIKIDKDGYHVVALYGDKKYHKGVHTLVCRAFNGEPSVPELQVRHFDGSKDNNTPENLIWGTPLENSEDRVSHGTQIRGTRVNTCKLNEGLVVQIRLDNRRAKVIAEDHSVSLALVYKIKSKEIWKHV